MDTQGQWQRPINVTLREKYGRAVYLHMHTRPRHRLAQQSKAKLLSVHILARVPKQAPSSNPACPLPILNINSRGTAFAEKRVPAAARRNMASPLLDSYSSTPKTSRVFSSLDFTANRTMFLEKERPQHCTASGPTAKLQEGAKADLQLYTKMSLP